MELLVTGTSPSSVIELVPEFGEWRHADDHYVVFFTGEDGLRVSTGSPVGRSLGELGGRRAPWTRAAATGEEVMADLVDLPADLRAATQEAGLSDCWAIPVEDPLHGSPAGIVCWRRATVPTIEVHRYALETMARALALILQWRQQETSLRRAARRDPLTGLANRTGFWEVLEGITADAAEPRVGVLYVDLDGFKAVNDVHGHRVGDLVLAASAQRISSILRPGDIVARLGGDEFAVVCRGLTGDEDVTAIAERLVSALEEPFKVDGSVITISCSVGIAVVAASDLNPDELLDAADRALYRAKGDGRGRWHLATSPR
jgi:diguanylate cyclase (GGDEF)-like protein